MEERSDFMSEKDVIQNSQKPLTKKSLVDDLKKLGLQKGDIVIAHASMSKLGWIVGRETTVIDALLEVIGEDGTLIMPSQTGENSDPTYWQNPPVPKDWIEIIKENMPPFDPKRTPTREMGKVVNALLSHPLSQRSNHPQVSFCGIGKEAKYILANHSLNIGLGKNSPLQKLYDKNAKILLLGVGYGNCTSLHLSETKLDNVNIKKQGARISLNNISQWVEFDEVSYDDEDFEILGKDYEKEYSPRKHLIGNYECRLIQMVELCDFALDWFKNNRKQ